MELLMQWAPPVKWTGPIGRCIHWHKLCLQYGKLCQCHLSHWQVGQLCLGILVDNYYTHLSHHALPEGHTKKCWLFYMCQLWNSIESDYYFNKKHNTTQHKQTKNVWESLAFEPWIFSKNLKQPNWMQFCYSSTTRKSSSSQSYPPISKHRFSSGAN